MTRALVLVALLALVGCTKETNELREPPAGPTPVPPLPAVLHVGYRVTGTIPNTRITYFSSVQGTTQVATDLPWAVTYSTTELHPFLSVGAETPLDNFTDGSLVVQIFVEGTLFREARGSGFVINVTASGEVP